MICDATGLQSSQITKFVTSKNQDACTTIAYPKLWRFFEQLRIVEGRPKSAERIQNERNHPNGFGLTKQAAAAAKPATVPSRCASGGGNDDVVDDDETDDEYFGLGPSPSKKSKKDLREEASKLMSRIALVNCDADPNVVYDSCPQIVKKVKTEREILLQNYSFVFEHIFPLPLCFTSTNKFPFCIPCLILFDIKTNTDRSRHF